MPKILLLLLETTRKNVGNKRLLCLLLSLLLLVNFSYAQQRTDTVQEDFRDDWAQLRKYREANKLLPLPKKGAQRVVFLGSSIFERWSVVAPAFFQNPNYINRGISGQISPQLLIRFQQDVIDLQPAAVVILAGSNDIAGSTGHVTNEVILNNIKSMTELAQRHGIKVILCAYLPVYQYPWRKEIEAAGKIIALNKAISAYAKKNNLVLLDYFTPLVDERNGQQAALTLDGVHPNAAGYEIMARVTTATIAKALDTTGKYTSWNVTGGGRENIKYSALNEIDTSNANQLAVAWVYHSEKGDSTRLGPMQCNPIIVNNILYGVSPKLKLFAINAATGKEIWQFDPADSTINKTWHRSSVNMNRGVAYWEEGTDQRIIYSVGPVVFAVNAATGRLVSSFGKDGGIDLRKGLGRPEDKVFVAPTSPLMVYKNLFFLSGQVGEETPGHIRAFDVKTGKQKWIFHTIPYPGEPGYETWEDKTAYQRMGSTNSWSGFSLDEKRGLLFAGTGNPTNDFYGGDRLGKTLYANCVLAIDAMTGKLKWHFQTVRHDVWDMDISSPPILVTLQRNGKPVDAVAQTTKTGHVFVFERATGKALFPIEERSVPTNTPILGEKLWPTQPFPVIPAPFARQKLTENDLNKLVSDSSYQDIRQRFLSYRSEGIYTPPTTQGTIILPGYDGGGEWGGPAFDPTTHLLYVNGNEMAWVLNLVKQDPPKHAVSTNLEAGTRLYQKNCMVCHGPERRGAGDYPGITDASKKYTLAQFNELLSTGRRMMPGFNNLSKAEKHAIASFILNLKSEQEKTYSGPVSNKSTKTGYTFTGYNKFLTKEGYPAISPPWGTLNAIDLNTGKYEWTIPLGEFEELKKKGIPATGRENYGAPVVTAGGLIFIAATADKKFRVIHKRTGKILLETELPASGVATPAVYAVNGKQYVVIACGGSKWGGISGDAYVAFSLPGNDR
jgi:quinoprotein glucose dehydrogenase